MKVLHIIGGLDLKAGGPSKSVLALSKYLNNQDVKSQIWTTNSGYVKNLKVEINKLIEYHGAKVVFFSYPDSHIFRKFRRLYNSGLFAFGLYWYLYKNIKKFELVHIHGFFSFYDLIPSLLSDYYNIPYLISNRGSLIKDLIDASSADLKNIYLNVSGRKILENATTIHCLTQYEREELMKFNFNLKKIEVLPNAIDKDDFHDLPVKNKLLELYPNLRNKKIILYLSRINFKKGLDDLIPSMREVIRYEPQSHLLIVGNDEENYITEVLNLIKHNGLEKNITYVGPAFGSAKMMYFQDSDIFILPSYSENFGLVVIEAMYFGLPVIISKNVGVYEHVIKANSGLVVNKNISEISEAIISMLKDKNKSSEMGRNGHDYVMKYLTWDKIIHKYINTYEDNLNQNIAL